MSFLFPSEASRQRRRDRVLAWVAVCLAALLVVRAARKDEGVLERNREFGARFLAHEDPYADAARGHRVHGPYPPSYVLVTVPLALVPTGVARVGWALAQVAALALCFVVLRRWTARGWPEMEAHASVLFAGALLLSSRFLLRDMAGGGGNSLYAALALWGIDCALRGRDILAGLVLAIPLVLKPNLAPLVLFLACRGRWRALASTALFALVYYWTPALLYGFSDYTALGARWFRDLAQFARAEDLADSGAIPDGFPLADTSMNQSVRDSLWRAFAPATAAWSARCVSIALVVSACAVAGRARGERAVFLASLAFLPVCVLISPISWKAHHVALLPLHFALVASAWVDRRKWLGIVLVVYYGTCVLLAEELVGKTAKNTLQDWSIVTVGAGALFVATLVLCERERAKVAS